MQPSSRSIQIYKRTHRSYHRNEKLDKINEISRSKTSYEAQHAKNYAYKLADSIIETFCKTDGSRDTARERMMMNIRPSCFIKDLTPFSPLELRLHSEFFEKYPEL